jgi:uncharacterized tellurite resistance protein B-like protein
MFERLINSFGQPANQQDSQTLRDPELQLASAMLLFGILPVDYEITAVEGTALCKSLATLFNFTPEKCHRLMSRAAAAHSKEPSIVAATTLLKHRTTEAFRRKLLAEANYIIRADGVLHDNELDLGHRLERMLGLSSENMQQSA